jgi:hypothetical protein
MSPAIPAPVTPPSAPAAIVPPASRRWLVCLAVVLVWQGWRTLCLFGPEHRLTHLISEQPIVSGQHALHLYHGLLGARAFWDRGTLCCYDPAFYAGYPKTPIFDSGSRPAELVLAITGGRGVAATYKIALALLSLTVPLVSYFAARANRLGPGPACLAALLPSMVWWSRPCREALHDGAVDLLLAAVLWPLAVACLLRHHRRPGPCAALGLTASLLLGCFAHPPLFILFLALFFIYYFSTGTRHRLPWHAVLWGCVATAVGLNAFWLVDWVGYWWICTAAPGGSPLPGSAWVALWDHNVWASAAERGLCAVLVGGAVVGVLLYRIDRDRPEARLFGLGILGLLVLAALGLTRESLRPWGGGKLIVPALVLAVLPATRAAAGLADLLRRRAPWRAALALTAAAAGAGFTFRDAATSWVLEGHSTTLQIGIDDNACAVLDALQAHTTPEARILWEDRHIGPGSANWTPLLPLLTGRAFIGGLDAEAGIEHAATGLADGSLAGRPLHEWTDAELGDYCRRYNVGWIVCSSLRARWRLALWSKARQLMEWPPAGNDGRALFAIDRPHSFTLIGSAQWVSADAQRIVLSDVVPQREDGRSQVILSLHHHAGMRVTPTRVRLERCEDPQDPIPLVRLLVTDPVARVTIQWDRR